MRTACLLAGAILLSLLAGCSKEEEVATFSPSPPIRTFDTTIGEYTFEPRGFTLSYRRDRGEMRVFPLFSARWRHSTGEPTIGVGIWQGSAAKLSWSRFTKGIKCNVDVPGIGTVPCIIELQTSWPIEQTAKPIDPRRKARPVLKLLYERDGSLLVLTHWGEIVQVPRSEAPDEDAWHESVLAEAAAHAGESPAVELLAALATEDRVLATCRLMEREPVVRASIDGGAFQDLAPGRQNSRQMMTCILPARPGQDVKLEVRAKFHRFVVTTRVIVEQADPTESPGWLTMEDRKIPFAPNGTAQADIGTLGSPRRIEFELPGRYESRSRQRAALLLRWGRPEERWLGSLEFPLSPPLPAPDLQTAAAALLADLEAGFDPDRGGYLRRRGESYIQKLGRAESAVLEHAGEGEHSEPVTAGPLLATLARSGPGYVEGRWGEPRQVFTLAVLWRAFPDLREDNPLQKVLDGWLAGMRENPDPTEYRGKGTAGSDSPVGRSFAIAALHIGSESFESEAFRAARDMQIGRLRDELKAAGVLGGGEFVIDALGHSDALELVSAWGQLAAFLGDRESLAEAQDFIVAMLARETDRGRAVHKLYEKETLSIRVGLLAVLRGSPGFLAPPTISR